jgi:hypothetical protein
MLSLPRAWSMYWIFGIIMGGSLGRSFSMETERSIILLGMINLLGFEVNNLIILGRPSICQYIKNNQIYLTINIYESTVLKSWPFLASGSLPALSSFASEKGKC